MATCQTKTVAYQPEHLIARCPNWYYADFEQRAFQLSYAFQSRQINSIAFWFSDSAKLLCALLAAWHANVRVLFVPNLTQESVVWANSHCDCWLTDQELDEAEIGANVERFDYFALEENGVKGRGDLLDFNPHCEFWLKTSGSSGKPKTIKKTAEQLWKNGVVCRKDFAFPQGNDVTVICTVSIQHLYGLICQIMLAFQSGWVLERKQQFFPEDIVAICKQSAKNVLISSPTMLASVDWQRLNFHRLIGITSAGGVLSPDVADNIQQHLGFAVTDFYGTTEAGAIAVRKGKNVWQAMTGAIIGTDERSALWIEADWLEGREQSEDVISRQDNGFIMLGRADRIIKLGDKRTSLSEIEQTLAKHCWIKDNYVGKHPIKQQRLAAWVALSEQGKLALQQQGRKGVIEALKQHLSQSQDKTALPRFWRFSEKLPRNSQSKISRIEFEQQFLADEHCY